MNWFILALALIGAITVSTIVGVLFSEWILNKTGPEGSYWKDHDKKVKRLSAEIDGSRIRRMHLMEKHMLGTITEAEMGELMRLSERRYREDW